MLKGEDERVDLDVGGGAKMPEIGRSENADGFRPACGWAMAFGA